MSRPPDGSAAEPATKPFLDHLEDLRRTLIRSGAALAAGMLVVLPFAPQVLGLLKQPLAAAVPDPTRFLKTLEVTGAFSASLSIAFWGGLLLSAPLVVFFVGRFVWPGLTPRERRVVKQSLAFSAGLFVAGAALGYRAVLPVALKVLLDMNRWLGVEAVWTLNSYLAFAVQLLVGFGLAFQLPLVLLVLGRLGIVRSHQLRHYRRHAIVALLIVGAVITPGPDVFSQLLVAGPLILLYELCIWLVRAAEHRRAEPAGREA